MKKLIAIALAISVVTAPAYAASTATFTMSANAVAQLSLTATLFKGAITATSTPVTTGGMNFGNLVSDSPLGPLRGTDFYSVLLTANTSGRQYKVQQTATAPTAGANVLPSGVCVVSANNNGVAAPTGAVIATANQTWVGTDKVLYTSEVAGSIYTVQGVYRIANNTANGGVAPFIPASQPAGAYAASVTFTLVLV